MILSEPLFCQENSNTTHALPTQNILYVECFPSTNLADAPLHVTSCKPQMSTLRLDITSTTSFDRPLIVPTFHVHTHV